MSKRGGSKEYAKHLRPSGKRDAAKRVRRDTAVAVAREARGHERLPAWVKCPDGCGDFVCTLHGLHVYDCSCPGIEVWARRHVDPYAPGSGGDA